MKFTVTQIIFLALFSVNGFAQEYTRWGLPEGAKLRLGKGEIHEIEYSPDGSRLAVASSTGIWLYDTVNYEETTLVGGQAQAVQTIAYALNGSVLVTASHTGGGVRLWDTATGERLPALGGDYRSDIKLAVSPDGSVLAIASYPHGLELRTAKTVAPLRSLADYSSAITSLAFSPDGAMLASAGHEPIVRIWNTLTGDELRTFERGEYGAARVVFNPHDGSLVILRSDGTGEVWDPDTGGHLLTLEKTSWPIVFNASGSELATGTFRGEIHVRNPTTGGRLYSLNGHTGQVASMAFSPDDKKIASAGRDGSLRIWDVKTASQEHAVTGHFMHLNYLTFSPDAEKIVVNASNAIHLFDTRTGTASPSPVPPSIQVTLLALSSDGSRMAGRTRDGIVLWDAETGQRLRNLPYDIVQSTSLAFSRDNRLLAVGGHFVNPTVTLWDAVRGELLHTYSSHTREVRSLDFSHDGRQLASGSADGTVAIVDTRTGEHRHTLNFDEEWGVVSVAYSPDGRWFASATYQEIYLWDVVTWDELHVLPDDNNINCNVAFSPDSRLVARGGFDKTVRIWDVKTGRIRRTLAGHTLPLNRVAFSPDGTVLASADGGGSALLWELTPAPTVDSVVSIAPSAIPSPVAGEQFTVELKISGGVNVSGYQATIFFDDNTLRFIDSHLGTYLGAGSLGVPPVLEGGNVTIGAAAVGTPAQGGGALAYLTFEVVELKPSFVSLIDVSLSDANGKLSHPYLEHAHVIKQTPLGGDVNRDGEVNILDLVLVAANFTKTGENDADVNGDGIVNVLDLVQVAGAIGGVGAAPTAKFLTLSGFSKADIESWLRQARELDLADPATLGGIQFLEQLLAALTPDETALLPNYPNPFNPETWIPYHLAQGADVEITIYDVQGALVRQLALGYRAAGYYSDRNMAAYWDGRNESGESVASGVYVCRLRAGDYSAARRMVIVK